jgi:hypothetical protein
LGIHDRSPGNPKSETNPKFQLEMSQTSGSVPNALGFEIQPQEVAPQFRPGRGLPEFRAALPSNLLGWRINPDTR